MNKTNTLVLCLAIGVMPLTGCSWMFMERAPQRVGAPTLPVQCTKSRAAPVLDSICGGYFAVNTVALLSSTSCDSAAYGEACIDSGTKTGGAILSGGLAALCVASAASGFRSASSCGAARELNAACMSGDGRACDTLRGEWRPEPAQRLPRIDLPSSSP